MLWLALHLPDQALPESPCTPPATGACRATADQGADDPLENLAAWAYQYSSRVCPWPPATLVLEIGASLNLFGGLQALLSRIDTGLRRLDRTARRAVAPTPRGACWLARCGQQRILQSPEALRQALDPLPLAVLDLEPRQHQALHGLGLRRLGDCLALPRRELARRLGPALHQQLDQALGHRPEPLPEWRPPARYRGRRELVRETDNLTPLLPLLERLLHELQGLLRGLDAGVPRFELVLEHLHRPASRLTVGLTEPDRDPERLLRVAGERLAREPLAAPVQAITLLAEDIQPLRPEPEALPGTRAAHDHHPMRVLLERLTARLGETRAHGLAVHPEHRPERAWRRVPPGQAGAAAPQKPRPTWLLERPRILGQQQGQPVCRGPLILERGPERIESGWWDGADVARDYYVARDHDGARLWIFRERRGRRRWFLHGLFG
ncbi:Y-family DNA polymerase [Alkalilimnicola ehrlichii]|uniref:UmuC domain-containing protein n=1 Tax=Alkalilimnicola ehrlichii (strain ATCC BAA-1101 / DSM 17681 / MLHE-1) TaxID=187272 RepID=Q0A9P1_ALKEH|nr:DNA polymerase Y family protein [Alkalilimnicola ehrlichii]ABI56446.1 conserved hypothetical protein [Alkalilimnicola ehrlichii MLHE-1]